MRYRGIDWEHCHAMRERLRQRQGGGLGRLEPIHGSMTSSDGRWWGMVDDNKARGARQWRQILVLANPRPLQAPTDYALRTSVLRE